MPATVQNLAAGSVGMNLDTKLAELEQQERIAIANVQRIQGAIAVVRQLKDESLAKDEAVPAEDTEAKAAVNGVTRKSAK